MNLPSAVTVARARVLSMACALPLLFACPRPTPTNTEETPDAAVSPADGGDTPDASTPLDAGTSTGDAGAQDAGPGDAANAPDAAGPPDAGMGDAAAVPDASLPQCGSCFVSKPGFPVNLPAQPVALGPLAQGNVFGDTALETVVVMDDAAGGQALVARVTAAGVLEAQAFSGGAAASGPALADFNGDGLRDVTWGDRAATVHGLAYGGPNLTGFPRGASQPVPAQGVFVDVDPGAPGAVVTFTVNANVFRVIPAGGNVPGWPAQLSEAAFGSGVTACNVALGATRPGVAAIIQQAGVPAVAAFDANGALLPGFPSAVMVDLQPLGVTCVDVDGNGQDEIALTDNAGRLHVINANGMQRAGFPVQVGPAVNTPVAAGDVDGNGLPDLVVGSRAGNGPGGVHVVSGDTGLPLSGFPVVLDGQLVGSPLLADTDGDGRCDVLGATAAGSVVRVDSRGSVRPVQSLRLLATPVGAPALADVDADGKWDLVVATQATLRAFTVDGSANNAHAPWVGYRGGSSRTGRYRGEPYQP